MRIETCCYQDKLPRSVFEVPQRGGTAGKLLAILGLGRIGSRGPHLREHTV